MSRVLTKPSVLSAKKHCKVHKTKEKRKKSRSSKSSVLMVLMDVSGQERLVVLINILPHVANKEYRVNSPDAK